MKRIALGLAALLLLLLGMTQGAAAQDKTFTGDIADEHLNCEQTPMKAPEGVKDKIVCVLYYARYAQPASKYVLYDPATKSTYQLDDQDRAMPYAGEKVTVTGTLNAATKTIKVTKIMSAMGGGKS